MKGKRSASGVHLVVVLVALACCAPRSVRGSCATDLAGVAPEEPSDIVVATYMKLAQLAPDSARKALFRSVLDGKDPFAIPKDLELGEVRTRMAQFHEMVKTMERDAEEVNRAILDHVSLHVGERALAQQRITRAVRHSSREPSFDFDFDAPMRVSPGWRYLAAMNSVPADAHGRLVDMDSGKSHSIGVPTDPLLPANASPDERKMSAPYFSIDESRMVFIRHDHLLSYELKNGKAESPKFLRLNPTPAPAQSGHAIERVHKIRPTVNPNQWLVTHVSPPGLFLYDFKAGTVRSIVHTEPIGPNGDWTTIPGTNEIVEVQKSSGAVTLRKATLLPDGTLSQWSFEKTLPGRASFADAQNDRVPTLVANHDYAVLPDAPNLGDITVVSWKDGSHRRLAWRLAENPNPDLAGVKLLLPPAGTEVYVVDREKNVEAFQLDNLITQGVRSVGKSFRGMTEDGFVVTFENGFVSLKNPRRLPLLDSLSAPGE